MEEVETKIVIVEEEECVQKEEKMIIDEEIAGQEENEDEDEGEVKRKKRKIEDKNKEEIEDVSRTSKLMKVANLYASYLETDLTIVVGGTSYPAHRAFISESSEVFKCMVRKP